LLDLPAKQVDIFRHEIGSRIIHPTAMALSVTPFLGTRRRGTPTHPAVLSPAGQLNASQIARASTLSRPTVSHHLKLLCEAGVLDRTKQGREIHFRLRAPQLIENLQSVIDYLEAHR
jgi:DNA-binding transcriptional ArsR family regulator